MYNAETNEIFFPLLIPGNELGGKVHTYNDVNSGIKRIEEFNLISNKFFGGTVVKLGLIGEYGFYACPHRDIPLLIRGFYIHDPSMVTELGKKLIQSKYPNAHIVYETVSTTVHRDLTPKEIEKKKELIEKAVDGGLSAPMIKDSTIEELEGLIRASASGKSKLNVVQEPMKATVDDRPVIVRKGKTNN